MATVTQLADRVCQVTGLATTGSERAIVLQALNQASDYANLEVGGYAATLSVTLTAGTADYVLKSAPFSLTDLLEIRRLRAVSGGLAYPLKQISETRMEGLRRGQSIQTIPQAYALVGTTEIRLWPTPEAGVTLTGTYLKEAKVLVESGAVSGEETTPSWLPKGLHHEVIGNGAIVYVLERENRFEEAVAIRARYELGIERASMWVSRIGGPTIEDEEFGGWGYENDRDRGY